jgi:hypothetical protein
LIKKLAELQESPLKRRTCKVKFFWRYFFQKKKWNIDLNRTISNKGARGCGMTIANPKEEIGTAKVGKHENWIRARTAARDAHAKAPTHISSLTSPLAVAEISQRKENRKMRQLLLSRPECTGGGGGGREEGNNLIWAAARHTFNFDDTGRHQLLMPLSSTGCCLYIARARYNLFALRAAVSLVVPKDGSVSLPKLCQMEHQNIASTAPGGRVVNNALPHI